jgi:cobalamin biosynthesis Mg chelatase CobN
VSRLYEYLSVVENRLFSEGLHTLGEPPSVDQVRRVGVSEKLVVCAAVCGCKVIGYFERDGALLYTAELP